MSKRRLPAAATESAVETLLRHAARATLRVGGTNSIVDVAIAVPRWVPREINRKHLTRIRRLGEGAFGEVNQYSVAERGSGIAMVAFDVAAKSIKAGADGAADARRALLREAALGAVLDHRNVVATLGVCTVPRDVPALLLLAYCSEGTLETLANAASSDSMSVAERLTYIAQTLQGLQYIAARRIVHRDVAARNVLLDATMTCKVGDLGMATALRDDGKEYIRADHQLALRWAAPEVVQEGKYSVQSDVWSVGVLAYEVFACGTLPYADQFDALTEVSAFVKQGGKLGRPNPEACPLLVYEELMLPCFAADPAARPAFGLLYALAVKHGADEDDVAFAEQAARRTAQERGRRAAATVDRADPTDRSLLGPSVRHLKATLVPAVRAAVEAIKQHGGHESQPSFDGLDPAEASIWHMVHSYAKPASADTICPRDGQTGCAYVDTLVGEDDIGRADALLSYSWGYLVAEVSAALSGWADRTDRDPKRTYIWICSLCLNQFRMADDSVNKDLQKEFGDRVLAIGRILPMLEPWHDPGYVKRAWCLFELYTSIQNRAQCEIDIILSPKESNSFRDRINADGTDARAVDEALAHVQSENAEASEQADLDAIRALIRNYPGGFDTLNDTVKTYLRRWFVSQGGVQVGARHGRAAAHAGARHPARQGPVRVERVHVAHFAGSVSLASSGGGGNTSSPIAAAAAAAAATPAPATAVTANTGARDPVVVSMIVTNPAYGMSSACEGLRDPGAAIAMPRSPLRGMLAPTPPGAAIGPSSAGGLSTEGARVLGPAVGATTYDDALPAALAGALAGVDHSGDHRDDGADDGGYMEVEGTSRPARRLESDVSLITDTGLGRQGSDVPLLDLADPTDPGIVQRRLPSTSRL